MQKDFLLVTLNGAENKARVTVPRIHDPEARLKIIAGKVSQALDQRWRLGDFWFREGFTFPLC